MNYIEQLIEENPKLAEECREKPKAISRFIGLARKLVPNKNPKTVNEELHRYFGHTIKQKEKKKTVYRFQRTVWVHKETGKKVWKQYGINHNNRLITVNGERKVVGDLERFFSFIESRTIGDMSLPEDEFNRQYEKLTEWVEVEDE